MKHKQEKNKPKTIEVVHSTYQPTKAELQQTNKPISASFEEVAKAMVQPVKVRWIDKPRDRR